MPSREQQFDDEDWSRLARHLAGEQDETAAAAVRTWLARERTPVADANEGLSTWHAVAPLVHAAARDRQSFQEETDQALARLNSRLAIAPARPVRRVGRLGAGIAAALVIAVPLAYQMGKPRMEWRTYTTGAAQRSSVVLPDGSQVELRASSRLDVRSGRRSLMAWATRQAAPEARMVRLQGEARFIVTHDRQRPFRVLAGKAVAEDLGTDFSVRAYPDDASVRVAVREGAVAVRPQAARGDSADYTRPAAMLAPGDVAMLDGAGVMVVTRNVDVATLDGWVGDRLVFRSQPLHTVLAQLNWTFDGRATVHDDATAERRVTIDIPARTLEAALRTLAALLDLDLVTQGDSIVLRPASRRPTPAP